MQDDVETEKGVGVVGEAKECFCEDKVAGTGNRKELGDSLEKAK